MKGKSTIRRYSCILPLLLIFFSAFNVAAQRCGFTSQITNGSIINLCSGNSLTLNAQPTGGSYTFKWQKQTSAGGPFADITGATNSGYTTGDLGAYRVLVSNGTCTDTSGITNLVRLAVQAGTISGGGSGVVCPQTNAGLLTGTAVPGVDLGIITYQWEKNVNNTGWTTIAGATEANYNVLFIDFTTSFRRVASDNCGTKALSNVITFTVTPEINAGTVAPLQQTINAGSAAATISSATAATGGSGSLSYQWKSSMFEKGPFSDIAGANSASYSPGVLNQTTYYVRVAIDNTCKTSKSINDAAVVFVRGGILNAGYFTSSSSCFFAGQTPAALETQAQPSGGVPPYTVEWQSSTDNVNFTSIPGANGSKYQPGILTRSTYFRKKVTDAAGTVAYSAAEKITFIETVLTGGSISSASSVACLGSAPSSLVSAGAATGFGEKLQYQWQYKTASSGNWMDIVGQIRETYTPDAITEKTTFRRLAIDACGNNQRTASSNEIVIDTRPALIAGNIAPAAQIIPAGSIPRLLTSSENPSGGTGSYTISWETSSLAVGPYTRIENASGLSYQPPAVSKTTYYRRVVRDNNCLAIKYSYVVEVTVSVNNNGPLVGGILAGSTCVFPGNRPSTISTSGIKLVSGGTLPYSFQWEKRAGFTGAFTTIPGATTESYQPEVISQTHQFRRRVTDAAGLTAYSDTITIEYHTAPLIAGTIAATTPLAICDNSIPGIIVSTASLSGYGEKAHYQWQIKIGSGEWTNIEGQIRENYSPTAAITQRTAFRRLGMDECGGVSRSVISNEVVFEVVPKITFKAGLVDGPFITCAGTAPGRINSVLDACGSGAIKYQWEINSGSGWSDINGATGPSYTPGAINQNTTYRRRAIDGCGSGGYSNEVMIYIYPPIEPGVIGTPTQTVCANVAPSKIGLLTNCHYTDGTVTYQWERATSATGPWVAIGGANGPEYQPSNTGTDAYYRLKVSSTTCSAVAYTNIAKVMVAPLCRVTISSASNSFCSSSTSPVDIFMDFNSDCTTSSFEWQFTEGNATSTSVWNNTGIGTVAINARKLFLSDPRMSFRVKITNSSCNIISYSNIAVIDQLFNCRSGSNGNNIQVYPNPTSVSNEVTIRTNLDGKNQVDLKTLQGKSLAVKVLSATNGVIRFKLPNEITSGTYFIHVKNQNGTQVIEKIVVAN